MNPWFKFYGSEYLSDAKIASLSAQERGCWLTLLCLASVSSTPGVIEFLTIEVLLEKSGIHFDPYDTAEWDKCLSVLDKFSRMRMINKGEDGRIEIVNWVKRQNSALTVAERQARYRENKKSNGKVTERVTNVTIEKNRIEKNRIENTREDVKTSSPSQQAADFFNGGETKDEVISVFEGKVPADVLSREMQKFCLYWTEKNKSGTKNRWEMQKTFEVKKRLYTWLSRSNQFTHTAARGRGIEE